MITQEKLRIYNRYKGDIDQWVRMGSKKEKAIMDDDDWTLIDGFVQDLQLVKKGLTSKEFSDTVLQKIVQNSDNPEIIINQLRKIEY